MWGRVPTVLCLFCITTSNTTALEKLTLPSMPTIAVARIKIGITTLLTIAPQFIVMQPFTRYMMQYLAWRVMCGLNRKIEISFLLVGHTKFAPDWCFGLLKQKFRKSLVGCLDDLARVVDQSAHTNSAQLVGREDGTMLVPQYDWAGFFQPFFRRGAFDGIKSWHHLVFSSASPCTAKVRVTCNAEEKTLTLLKEDWNPCPTELPQLRGESIFLKRSGNLCQ